MRKIIVIIVCIALGPFLVWTGLTDLIKGRSSKSWPTVEGTITSTNLTESQGRRGIVTYTPALKYDYEVAGTTYTGDRVDNGDRGTLSMEDATETLARYRKGHTVKIHYNPKDPANALLEVGPTGGNWFLFGGGLAMTGIGLFAGFSFWRRSEAMTARLRPASEIGETEKHAAVS